ncbi:MAG: hypothetical protein L6R37_008312, partial [Teloschistes peruensis]
NINNAAIVRALTVPRSALPRNSEKLTRVREAIANYSQYWDESFQEPSGVGSAAPTKTSTSAQITAQNTARNTPNAPSAALAQTSFVTPTVPASAGTNAGNETPFTTVTHSKNKKQSRVPRASTFNPSISVQPMPPNPNRAVTASKKRVCPANFSPQKVTKRTGAGEHVNKESARPPLIQISGNAKLATLDIDVEADELQTEDVVTALTSTTGTQETEESGRGLRIKTPSTRAQKSASS